MAIVKKYLSRIINIENTINDVYTLEIESLGRPFKYEPGQFLHLAIDDYDPSSQWPDSRCFSMRSSPDYGNIIITYSVRGQFTSRMKETLKIGSTVWLKMPYGNLFTQPHGRENTVFIAGGTGITPFLSLFSSNAFKEYVYPRIYLGFRGKRYNIYQSDLDVLKENNIKYEIECYYEDNNGLLDINEIFRKNGVYSHYFISGPPAMIKIFKHSLMSKGVAANNVFTDEWD